MALDFVDRPVDSISPLPYTRPSSPRPINGVVLHHTASASDPAAVRFGASWHWLVGRATLYRDVDEPDIAHHVGATDRWRPTWVVTSPYALSDINYCSIGIEITCAPQNVPPQGYTDYQYATLRALLDDLYARYGPLPIVGHGEVDLSKWPTEPHGLDYARLGIGPRIGNAGRFLNAQNPPQPEPPPVPEEPAEDLPPPPWDGLWKERDKIEAALREEVAALKGAVAADATRYAALQEDYNDMEQDRSYNYEKAIALEANYRVLEQKFRVKRGTTEAILAPIKEKYGRS